VGTCTTKGHKTKLNVASETLYIKQTCCTMQACLDPSLPLVQKPKDLSLNEPLGMEHAFQVWVAYFDALKATKLGLTTEIDLLGSPGSWEDVNLPTLASLTKANGTFTPPGKLKLGPDMFPS
jgi:hypothetical protein